MAINGALPATLQPMTVAMKEAMQQLWQHGPTWDGNVISKIGRNELVTRGWAFHSDGHAYLSPDGVKIAVGLFGPKDR